jgi:outer membrane protein OmpA-like peptidoglycan-associated protein
MMLLNRRCCTRGATPLVLTLVLTLGCASLDPAGIDQARGALQQARTSEMVQSDSLDLREAERHFSAAEEGFMAGDDQEAVDHQAYLAAMYARVAVARGEALVTEEESVLYLEQARRETTGTAMAVDRAIRNAEALDARQTDRGLVLTLGGVLFGFDSDKLKPEAATSVARVAGFLIALDDREVLVEGYTDNVGKDGYNVALSKRRAESVVKSLVENGLAPNRAVADGYGAAFPVAPNDDDAGRAMNRRVEIIILERGVTAASARRGG